jgi:POT family proton-dependent oligopeptide transporter
MLASSHPASLSHESGVPGLAAAMVLVGLGVGGVKATISPLLADQYVSLKPLLMKKKNMNDELVVGDRTMTIQYIFNVFYW